jgi:hypothetical protein
MFVLYTDIKRERVTKVTESRVLYSLALDVEEKLKHLNAASADLLSKCG